MNWKASLNTAEEKYIHAFESLTEAELNYKPSDKEWSIAQILDHLVTVNASYFDTFDQVLAGKGSTHIMAKIPGMPSLFGNMLYKASHESRGRKGKTVAPFEPSQSNIDMGIWKRFKETQKRMESYLVQFDAQHLQRVISSPAAPFIVYRVAKALDIICTHEHRHLKQALEVQALLRA